MFVICCTKRFEINMFKPKLFFFFQDGGHDGHLLFPTKIVLAIVYLQFATTLPIKFRVNWPFGLGEDA